MTATVFVYQTPRDWLIAYIAKSNSARIRLIAVQLACTLDNEAIQDLFQEEMNSDDYFEKAECPCAPHNKGD